MAYDLKTIDAPRMQGSRLRFLAWLLERRIGKVIAPGFLSRLGIEQLRSRHYKSCPPAVFYPIIRFGMNMTSWGTKVTSNRTRTIVT